MGGRDRPDSRVRPNCLRFIQRDWIDIRSYHLYQDGVIIGRVFVWPHHSACFYDNDGSMTHDLSTEPGSIRRVLAQHASLKNTTYRLF